LCLGIFFAARGIFLLLFVVVQQLFDNSIFAGAAVAIFLFLLGCNVYPPV